MLGGEGVFTQREVETDRYLIVRCSNIRKFLNFILKPKSSKQLNGLALAYCDEKK